MIMRERLPVRVTTRGWLIAMLLAAIALPGWTLVAIAQQVAGETQASDSALAPRASADPVLSEDLVDGRHSELAPTREVPSLDEPSDEGWPASRGTASPLRIPQPRTEPVDEGGSRRQTPIPPLGAADPQSRHREQRAHVVESDSFTLTRTTYRLPPRVAERLEAFLEQNLSWPHLLSVETVERDVAGRVREGEDSTGPSRESETLLLVTASPSAQEVIGNLIGLMLESKPSANDERYVDPT
jgi:hypothetical protein